MTKNIDSHYAERVEDKIFRIANNLRRLADEVEREAARLNQFAAKDIPAGGETASNVVYAVAWGMANLNLNLLIQAAADYDREVLKNGE